MHRLKKGRRYRGEKLMIQDLLRVQVGFDFRLVVQERQK